jgi:hypothetical protein
MLRAIPPTHSLDALLAAMDTPDQVPVLDRSFLDDAESLQDLALELGCPLTERL